MKAVEKALEAVAVVAAAAAEEEEAMGQPLMFVPEVQNCLAFQS